MKKYAVGLSEGIVKPEFVYEKDGITTFECRELISKDTIGAKDIVLFRAIFGPREAHSKHLHKNCVEIVHCISGRGVEGIEVSPGVYKEFEYVPGLTIYLPKGTAHYTRNPEYFENLFLLGIFLGVGDMDKATTGYESMGDILESEMILE